MNIISYSFLNNLIIFISSVPGLAPEKRLDRERDEIIGSLLIARRTLHLLHFDGIHGPR